MKIKLKILLLIIYFTKSISISVYHCSPMDFMYQQCMLNYTDKNGDTHILLKQCPENKICQPTRDYSMGFCIYNIKELSPGHKCYYFSQCSTRYCLNNICQGYSINKYCNHDKMECDNRLTCKKTLEERENRYVYKCQNVSELNEPCENNYECGFNLVCGYYQNLSGINTDKNNIEFNDIKTYFNSSDFFNLTKNKYCMNISSIENGGISNEEMACESGQLIPIEITPEKIGYICGSKKQIIKNCNNYNKCIIEVDIGLENNIQIEQDCIFSNIGNLICPLDEKEKAWKNYLEKRKNIFKQIKNKESLHIPYDKFTLQNNEVMEAYWEYYDWIHSIEGDECTKDYFFIKNKGNIIIYNIYYILGILLLYILFL